MELTGLWITLERFGVPATMMAEWREVLREEYDDALAFLRPTDYLADAFPCTNRPYCGCRHAVIMHAPNDVVAACRCDRRQCRTIPLQPKDILIYALDRRRLCESIQGCLGFEPPADRWEPLPCAPNTILVGTYGPTCSPVYFSHRQTSAEFLTEVVGLMSLQLEPFILLAPTDFKLSVPVQGLLQRQKCAFLGLSRYLALDGPGRFRLLHSPGPVLDQFARRLAEKGGAGEILQGIHREIATVRTDFNQLREAKRRLEAMAAEGLFKFTQKIDVDSLKVICAILAHGDVAKAGRMLNLTDSSMRRLLRRWRRQGKEYKRLLDLVRWRKKMGRTEVVHFDDSILQNKLSSSDYQTLVSDVLEGLLSLNEDNWQIKCEELAEALRPHVAIWSD